MTGPRRYSRALSQFVAYRKGSYLVLSVGDELPSSDPIVKSNPTLFAPVEPARVAAPPVKRAERRKKA